MLYLIMVGIILLDQFTKLLASVWGWASLNVGISFGWLSPLPPWLLTLCLFALLVGVWGITKGEWAGHPVAAGMFVGGAVSNLIDRILLGGVRDWLPIPMTTIHNNLADYAILVGLILLIVDYWQDYWLNHAHSDQLEEHDDN